MFKPYISVFPKYAQHLSLEELAEWCNDAGVDAVNAVVRDGYWVSESNLAESLPVFKRSMESAGLRVSFASTSYPADALVQDDTPLRVMADNGIEQFRTGYFRRPGDGDIRTARKHARETLTALEPLCERAEIQAVVQLHGGTIHQSFSSAYSLVEGLNPKYVALEPDPGNQVMQEGYEVWHYGFNLLSEYVAALGVKDAVWIHNSIRSDEPDKGWRREWAPIYEGIVNWQEVVTQLRSISFKGPLVFMPFYDECDFITQTEKFHREVAYLRRILEL